jgi:hypothetical protein
VKDLKKNSNYIKIIIFEFPYWELLRIYVGDRRSRDRMVVGFTIIYASNAYHH